MSLDTAPTNNKLTKVATNTWMVDGNLTPSEFVETCKALDIIGARFLISNGRYNDVARFCKSINQLNSYLERISIQDNKVDAYQSARFAGYEYASILSFFGWDPKDEHGNMIVPLNVRIFNATTRRLFLDGVEQCIASSYDEDENMQTVQERAIIKTAGIASVIDDAILACHLGAFN